MAGDEDWQESAINGRYGSFLADMEQIKLSTFALTENLVCPNRPFMIFPNLQTTIHCAFM